MLFRFDRGRQLLVGYRIASVLLRDPRQPGVSAPDFGDESPCPPDPDADGETDVEDIAYTLQIAHGLPASVPPGEAVAPVDPECEPQCAGT